jgi:hypothetical protein
MKWVKCVYNNTYVSDIPVITVGKVYKVLHNYGEANETVIVIYNDMGEESYWSMIAADDNIWFEDVTVEIRDNKINAILDY